MKYLLISSGLMLLFSCTQIKQFGAQLSYTSSHSRYLISMKKAGLNQTSMGEDWIKIAEESLGNAKEIELEYEETSYFAANRIDARAYKLKLEEGQIINVDVKVVPRSFYLFTDLYEKKEKDGKERYILLTAVDPEKRNLQYKIKRGGVYVLRLQPRLLAGGRYELSIQNEI